MRQFAFQMRLDLGFVIGALVLTFAHGKASSCAHYDNIDVIGPVWRIVQSGV
jgi:hypothetical protein